MAEGIKPGEPPSEDHSRSMLSHAQAKCRLCMRTHVTTHTHKHVHAHAHTHTHANTHTHKPFLEDDVEGRLGKVSK